MSASSDENNSGSCLDASLAIAAEFAATGRTVVLARWRVSGDPRFSDHWAVMHDAITTIDPSWRNLGSGFTPVMRLEDYPNEYFQIRYYPAGLFLARYRTLDVCSAARLPLRFLWFVGRTVMRHDLKIALRNREYDELICAPGRCLAYCFGNTFKRIADRLGERKKTLLQRL